MYSELLVWDINYYYYYDYHDDYYYSLGDILGGIEGKLEGEWQSDGIEAIFPQESQEVMGTHLVQSMRGEAIILHAKP